MSLVPRHPSLTREETVVMSTKERICLRCGYAFLSAGPWNRICERCAQYTPTTGIRLSVHIDVETAQSDGGKDT